MRAGRGQLRACVRTLWNLQDASVAERTWRTQGKHPIPNLYPSPFSFSLTNVCTELLALFCRSEADGDLGCSAVSLQCVWHSVQEGWAEVGRQRRLRLTGLPSSDHEGGEAEAER